MSQYDASLIIAAAAVNKWGFAGRAVTEIGRLRCIRYDECMSGSKGGLVKKMTVSAVTEVMRVELGQGVGH